MTYMTQEEIDAEQALMVQQRSMPEFDFERAAEQSVPVDPVEADNVTPLDLLVASNYTDKATRDARFDICKGCERLFKPTRSCKECGCFMALKTWLIEATCPLGKW